MKFYVTLFVSIFIFQCSYGQQRILIGNSQYGISGNFVYKADTMGNTDWVLDFSGKIKTGISDTNSLFQIASDGRLIYITSMQTVGSGIVTYYPAIIVLDTLGNTQAIRYWQVNPTGSYFFARMIPNIDGGIWLYDYFTSLSYHLSGHKIDTLGAITNTIGAWMSTDTYFNGMELMNDSSYVLTTLTPFGPIASRSTVTKINRLGSAIWRKSIRLSNIFCYPGASQVDSAGNTIMFFNFTDNGSINFSGGAIFSPTGTVITRRIWPNDSILPNGEIGFQNQAILYDDGTSQFNFDYTLLDSCLGSGEINTLIITPETLQVGSGTIQYSSNFLPGHNSLSQVGSYHTIRPPSYNSLDYCLVLNNGHLNIKSSFEIFPNPVSGFFRIRSIGFNSNNEKIIYQIFNLNSSLIKQGIMNVSEDETASIDVSQYPNGIYLIKIISDNHMNLSKFVKM